MLTTAFLNSHPVDSTLVLLHYILPRHFTHPMWSKIEHDWVNECIVYAANCNLKFSIIIQYNKRVKYSNKKNYQKTDVFFREGRITNLSWSEINIYSINIHISCYELHVGLKYVIVGRSQPLESEETAGRGFVIGCPSWLLPEYSSSYLLERGSRCYQVTVQECDLKGTLTHTQRLVIWLSLVGCFK